MRASDFVFGNVHNLSHRFLGWRCWRRIKVTFNIGKQSLLLAYGNGITRGGINIALPSPVLCRLKPQVGNLTVTDLAGNLLLPLKSGLTISGQHSTRNYRWRHSNVSRVALPCSLQRGTG